jgi:hypothetical protein
MLQRHSSTPSKLRRAIQTTLIPICVQKRHAVARNMLPHISHLNARKYYDIAAIIVPLSTIMYGLKFSLLTNHQSRVPGH